MWSNLMRAAAANQPHQADTWGDDDDDEGNEDYIDEGEDDDMPRQEQESSKERQQQHHQQQQHSGGPNVFMGRLTRFLEQVTHPDDDYEEEDYEEEEDGWGEEDDGLQGLEGDEGENVSDEPMAGQEQEIKEAEQEGWEHDEDTLDFSERNVKAAVPPPEVAPVSSDEGANGWEEDEEPSSLVEDKKEDAGEGEGWGNDEALDFPESAPKASAVRDETPVPAQDANGWDDDEDALQFSERGLSNASGTSAVIAASTRGAVAQAQQNLQAVLDEIDHQETQASPTATMQDTDESSAKDDERHAQTAVKAIQQEMNQMLQVEHPKIVDQIPHEHPTVDETEGGVDDPSLVVLANAEDFTRDSGPSMNVSSEQDVYDDENEMAYGPVVDHLPSSHPMSRHDSIAVQVKPEEVEEEEDLLDASTGWGDEDGVDDIDLEEGNDNELLSATPHPPPVVDHLPVNGRGNEEESSRYGCKDRNPSIGVLASEADSLSEGLLNGEDDNVRNGEQQHPDAKHVFGPVVDHIPDENDDQQKEAYSTGVPRAPVSGSLAVQAISLAEDFQQDDDMDDTLYGDSTIDGAPVTASAWDDDDVDVDYIRESISKETDESAAEKPKHAERKTASFSPNLTVEVHLVDHTPSEMPASEKATDDDPSMNALATEEDLTRDTGKGDDEDVYDDENEEAYGPVVDHTPTTPSADSEQEPGTNNSMAVHASALKNEIEEDDKMDDSYCGDSTLGGTMDGTAGDGWDHDDEGGAPSKTAISSGEPASGNDIALVDYTPSEMEVAPPVNDPSIDVVASEATTECAGEADSTDGNAYGPVVDQTPTTPVASRKTRSDSVVVQVHDLDTVDENTLVGQSTVGTIEEELPPLRRVVDDQLVDHVPNRPASRFGDASTLVAADPSEVMSEVDDMMQEDGNFGPVVDQTPPAQPAAAEIPSGAGSTAVFAPSVPADDLDDADETEVNDEQSGWGAEEAQPNPQSGNDEPVVELEQVDDTQVVDFVPEEEAPTEHAAREQDISEMTVGGAQSILQPEDKEDNYGPVVDQTPNLQGSSVGLSQASIATQLTPSECRAMARDDEAAGALEPEADEPKSKVVVDQLPQFHHKIPADSLATVARSQLSEDDVEEDDSKFGPVVDHLPTPRQSLAPSRGGSTVDALGTVSEVNSDGDGGEGWDDDDVDFDTSEGCISDGAALPASAVRPALRQPNDSSSEPERGMSVRFDSSVNDTAAPDSPNLNETEYFDPELGGSGTKADETQFFDPESGTSGDWTNTSAITELHNQVPSKSFAEADTPPSTPYRRSELASPEVNEDITDQMRPAVPFIRAKTDLPHCDMCEKSSTGDCPCVQELLKVNDQQGTLVGKMKTPDGRQVEVDFSKLLKREIVKRRLIEEECHALRSRFGSEGSPSPIQKAEETNPELWNRVVVLENDCNRLRNKNECLEKDLSFAREELNKLRGSEARLSQMEKLETERVAARLKDNVAFLEEQLAETQKQLAEALQSQKDLETQTDDQRSISVEMASLRDAKEMLSKRVVDLEVQHEEELQRQYKLLDKKASDLRAMESSKNALEEEKTSLMTELTEQRALAKQAESLAGELLSVAEERDVLQESLDASNDAIASLQKLIDEHGMEQSALQSKRDLENAELKTEVKNLSQALSSSEAGAEGLRNELDALRNEKNDLASRLMQTESRSQNLEAMVESANSNAAAQASNVVSLKDELNQLRVDFSNVSAERDRFLKEKETSITHLTELGRTLKHVEEQTDEWKSMATELEQKLLESQAELKTVSAERDALAAENSKLTTLCQEMEAGQAALSADFSRKQEESAQKSQEAFAEVSRECERVKAELEAMRGVEEELQVIQSELEDAVAERDRLNEENEDMLVQFGLLKQEMDLSEEQVRTLQYEMRTLQEAGEVGLSEKTKELESMRLQTKSLAGEVDMLKEAVQSLKDSCIEKDKAIAARDMDISALRGRLANMMESSEMLELENKLYQREQALANERTRADALDEKNKTLRSQLDDAKAQLAAADSMNDLRQEVESLSNALQATRERLAKKEEEVDNLTSEMMQMQTKIHQGSPSRSHSHGDDDDVEALKSRMVQLAVALERSETKRAEAIERLLSERQTNAESLRRLSESMKRYYSTVSSGDA